jgi:hypothetical protein
MTGEAQSLLGSEHNAVGRSMRMAGDRIEDEQALEDRVEGLE